MTAPQKFDGQLIETLVEVIVTPRPSAPKSRVERGATHHIGILASYETNEIETLFRFHGDAQPLSRVAANRSHDYEVKELPA